MDNDQRPPEPENNNQYNQGYQGYQPANAYYGNPYNGGGGSRGGGRRKGLAAVIAIIMVICLVVGGIITAYVIMPGIYPSLRGDSDLALATPDKDGAQPGNNSGPGSLTITTPSGRMTSIKTWCSSSGEATLQPSTPIRAINA